jgi:hypothetical protein
LTQTIKSFRKQLNLPANRPPQKGRPTTASKSHIKNEKIVAIIDAFGGNTKMAKILNTAPVNVSQWKNRGSIGKSWFKPIIQAAQKQRPPLSLTIEDIVNANEEAKSRN